MNIMSFKENFDWNIHKSVGNRVISLVSQCPQLERNVINSCCQVYTQTIRWNKKKILHWDSF